MNVFDINWTDAENPEGTKEVFTLRLFIDSSQRKITNKEIAERAKSFIKVPIRIINMVEVARDLDVVAYHSIDVENVDMDMRMFGYMTDEGENLIPRGRLPNG